MRRNIHYKPSKGMSVFSGVIACAMGVFGLFTIPSIGAMIGFKAIWCLMTFGMGIYNFLLAAGVVKYNGGYEITDESDDERKGRQVRRRSAARGIADPLRPSAHYGRGVSGKAQGHSGPTVRERSADNGRSFDPYYHRTCLGV